MIYAVLIDDRHTDPVIELFAKREHAVAYCKEYVAEVFEELVAKGWKDIVDQINEENAEANGLWLYSTEGDSCTILEVDDPYDPLRCAPDADVLVTDDNEVVTTDGEIVTVEGDRKLLADAIELLKELEWCRYYDDGLAGEMCAGCGRYVGMNTWDKPRPTEPFQCCHAPDCKLVSILKRAQI